jgi:hypothetical protein
MTVAGSNETASAVDFDAIVVGAGFAGLNMLHDLRQLGFRSESSNRAETLVEPGIGTDIRVPAVTARACTTCSAIASPETFSRSGRGVNVM